MPTNLYSPTDTYDLAGSHVIPAMIRKFHEAWVTQAPHVVLWGTGAPRREFLYADDLARACVFLMGLPDEAFAALVQPEKTPLLNIGYAQDQTIGELAVVVRETVGYRGNIVWDRSRPDGTPQKLLDASRMGALGWQPAIGLREGMALAYRDFLSCPEAHTAGGSGGQA